MSNPLVPNYVKGVGRLVTDRYDFQDHIDGYSFRHDATQIDLSPAITFDGYTETTVQSALQILSTYVTAPVVPDATTTSKGIIQLSGDISGTATSVTVSALQGSPIQPIIPSAVGQVLTWDGIGWYPDNATNAFTAGSDLYGTSTNQFVQNLSGDPIFNYVTILGPKLTFEKTQQAFITQDDMDVGPAGSFYITAQSTTDVNFNGAALVLSGGNAGGGTGLKGAVQLSTGGVNTTLVELAEVVQNQLVLSLCNTVPITNIQMPANTGSGVIYIKNAATDPGAGVPSGGAILYASTGKLYIKQSDGDNFAIGSIPNPSIWGGGTRYVYSYRATTLTTNATPAVAFSYVMPNSTIVKADILIVGKNTNPAVNEAYQTNMSRGFTIDSTGTVAALSATQYFDTQSAGLGGITPPSITNVGTTLSINTGALAATNINWLVVVQLTVCG
jgi:hypothetical protein